MKAAMVQAAGQSPVYADFEDPVPEAGEATIHVRAAALSTLAKSRASGSHYSSRARFPFVAGVDGVGRLEDGRRVYFILPRAPFGSMAQTSVAPVPHVVPLPDDLDDASAAALGNPAMGSWVALTERAKLAPGETVLVNGGTGTAGTLAVQVAKYLGARRVVVTGRSPPELEALSALGADAVIPLGDSGPGFEDAVAREFAGDGVDVVLDYLWGPSAERILVAGAKAGKEAVPIRFVHVGSLTARTITLPSAALRGSAVSLMGSGIGSVPKERIAASIGELMEVAAKQGFRIATRSVPLSQVAEVWSDSATVPRIVFRIE